MKLPGIFERGRTRLFVRLVGNGLAQGVAALAGARFVHYTFDHVISDEGPLSWLMFVALAAGIGASALLLAALRMLERTDAERISQDYVKQVRVILFEHMSKAPVRLLQRRSRGGMMLRFIGDLKALRAWVSLGLARVIVACVSIAASLVGLALLNPPMAFAATAIILGGVALGFAWGKRMQQVAMEARRRQSELAANVGDKIASMAVVQAFGQSRRERRRVENQGERVKRAMITQAKTAAQLRGLADLTAALASGAVMLVGSYEVRSGTSTSGTVVAAMAIIGVAVPVLRDLGMAFVYWQTARISRMKIGEFLATPLMNSDAPGLPDIAPGPGRIEFRNTRLGEAVRGITASVEPGKRIAIVGPNGAGKSTLLSLAARLIEPEDGAILIDGQDLARVSASSIRRRLGMVSPDLPLLRGSLERNLRYRCPEATPEELKATMALCGIDETLSDLPEGLRTRVTEGGGNLSPGQRQRIALARALLGKPKVLLLDEAESNLDPRSREILKRIVETFEGTVLIVTHRRDLALKADEIWHLSSGALLERGKPEEVLGKNGPTAQLFRNATPTPTDVPAQ